MEHPAFALVDEQVEQHVPGRLDEKIFGANQLPPQKTATLREPRVGHDKRLGIPATVLAILIAFSRLYLYVHYPTDVLVSVVLGILFGILGNLIVNAIYKKFVYKGKYIEE